MAVTVRLDVLGRRGWAMGAVRRSRALCELSEGNKAAKGKGGAAGVRPPLGCDLISRVRPVLIPPQSRRPSVRVRSTISSCAQSSIAPSVRSWSRATRRRRSSLLYRRSPPSPRQSQFRVDIDLLGATRLAWHLRLPPHQNSMLKPSHLRVRRERLGVICGFVGGCVGYAALAIKVRSAGLGGRFTPDDGCTCRPSFPYERVHQRCRPTCQLSQGPYPSWLQRKQHREASKLSSSLSLVPRVLRSIYALQRISPIITATSSRSVQTQDTSTDNGLD
ncbi:uncharacterized protein SCHCODRAFT_02219551 [Schizophyllum commune H4-8]|uniref:uncharacterized protein n=1 Tax=Schizophyllum commune (strain H4-8 / FGSC 9210) TaxID=578458 RepID=UPI00215F9FF8|nr:uncharacterized protein SCHCODRAFT_02219551 [Schizophyllum commune H4-8]KAI5894934.1 hypothetical protein SCHCODRAFT_02219551 [Schizophyllum commune H4-8]